MNEVNIITCGICEDLAPLVEDGAACEESREAVLRHIGECPECRKKYPALAGLPKGNTLEEERGPDDAKVISKIRDQISVWLLGGALLSLMLGAAIVSLSAADPWLAALIFPWLCGLLYLSGVRIRKWAPLAAGCCWIVIVLLTQSARLADYPMALLSSLYPIALSYMGMFSAALLKYAFKGEFR